MSFERLKLGDPIPLIRNAFDGNEGLFPQATLRDASNAVIGTFDLEHIGDGIYRNDAQAYPATPLVTALYIVYVDAGHTELSCDYEETSDVFLRLAEDPCDIVVDIMSTPLIEVDISVPNLSSDVIRRDISTDLDDSTPSVDTQIVEPTIFGEITKC